MNKYLFFDIECADGYNICAFGYVITDQSFKVLLKEDIKINPKKKVLTEGRRPTDDFHLGYTDFELKGESGFKDKYEKLKNLLEDANCIIVGHSVDSDGKFLRNACRDNKLRYIKFKALDIQKIFKCLKKSLKQSSLKNIGIELGVNYKEENHTGLSGAILTMECFKALCCKIGFDAIAMLDDKKYTTNSIPEIKQKKEKRFHSSYTIGEVFSKISNELSKEA
jgi:DNA polymerase III epsilon subunit-like protein